MEWRGSGSPSRQGQHPGTASCPLPLDDHGGPEQHRKATLLRPEQGFPEEVTGCPGLLPQPHMGRHVLSLQHIGSHLYLQHTRAGKPYSLPVHNPSYQGQSLLSATISSVTSESNLKVVPSKLLHKAAARLQPLCTPNSRSGSSGSFQGPCHLLEALGMRRLLPSLRQATHSAQPGSTCSYT